MEGLPKCQSGIRGLDEITDRGLLKGRPMLVCGSAEEPAQNVASLGFDLKDLEARKKDVSTKNQS